MEPDAIAFLKKVSKTILFFFIWAGINAIAAIKGDNAFIAHRITTGNIVFYVWFILSIVLLAYILKRLWQGKPE